MLFQIRRWVKKTNTVHHMILNTDHVAKIEPVMVGDRECSKILYEEGRGDPAVSIIFALETVEQLSNLLLEQPANETPHPDRAQRDASRKRGQ